MKCLNDKEKTMTIHLLESLLLSCVEILPDCWDYPTSVLNRACSTFYVWYLFSFVVVQFTTTTPDILTVLLPWCLSKASESFSSWHRESRRHWWWILPSASLPPDIWSKQLVLWTLVFCMLIDTHFSITLLVISFHPSGITFDFNKRLRKIQLFWLSFHLNHMI